MTAEATQLPQDPLMSPTPLIDDSKIEQETQEPDQQDPQSTQGPKTLLNISKAHLFSSKETSYIQGHQEKEIQTSSRQVIPPVSSLKTELKPAKKSGNKPRSRWDDGSQKELVIPETVDFELIQEALKIPKAQTPGAYRFGRLSHHSFFSRHHPHPQRVTHIQDLTGKPVCVIRDEFSLASLPRYLMGMPTISVPIGDPQSNREPQLSSGEAWKKELRDLASRVAIFTKENELKGKESVGPPSSQQKEKPQREQGAKYSAETGRLIPTSTPATGRHSSRQSRRNYTLGKDKGVQTFILQDQELLVLELLCQILQTDSLSSIQFWLLYAPPKEKDLALGLLQTAVAQLLPQPLLSIPSEKLLNQLQEVQELQEKPPPPSRGQEEGPPVTLRKPPSTCEPHFHLLKTPFLDLESVSEEREVATGTKKREARIHWKSTSSSNALKPKHRGEDADAKSRVLKTFQHAAHFVGTLGWISGLTKPSGRKQYYIAYHTEPIKMQSPL